MRYLSNVFVLCLLGLGLQSCQWLIANLRSFPQAKFNPDQNIILFRTQLTGNSAQPMPVSVQLDMLRTANASLRQAGKDTLRISHWCPCDSSLVLLEGKNLSDLLINGKEMASNTRPNDGVEGRPPFPDIKYDASSKTLNWPQLIGDGSRNYETTLPFYNISDSKLVIPFLNFPTPQDSIDQPFIIAVTDTGVQPGLYPTISNRFWVNPGETPDTDRDRNGLVGDMTGWDFVGNAALPYDSNGHGTLVTSLIHEQLKNNRWATKNVRYMFLKTYGSNGKGTLFNNLCAMSYARQKGAKIINASWGFYSQQESALLSYFIRELNANGIALVVAAGNENEVLERTAMGLVPKSIYRNLESNPFWPAHYSFTHPNLITVTTIHPTTTTLLKTHSRDDFDGYAVCDDQNWSNKYVNVGVFNNRNGKIPYCEVLNFTVPGDTVRSSGTSFATPVVTGKIVNRLGETWNTNKRDGILYVLGQPTPNALPGATPLLPILNSHSSLKSQIKNSAFVKRIDP